MDFEIPQDVQTLLKDLDDFIEAEIKPLEQQDDNLRFFDHRREYERTDFENGGVPRKEWDDLLAEMRRRADKAGFLRYGIPSKYGGRDGSNLARPCFKLNRSWSLCLCFIPRSYPKRRQFVRDHALVV